MLNLCSTLQVCHVTIRPPVDVLRTLDPLVPYPASHPPPSLDDVSTRNASTCSGSTSEEPSPHQLTPTSASAEGPVQLCWITTLETNPKDIIMHRFRTNWKQENYVIKPTIIILFISNHLQPYKIYSSIFVIPTVLPFSGTEQNVSSLWPPQLVSYFRWRKKTNYAFMSYGRYS